MNPEGIAFTIWNLSILVVWALGMILYLPWYVRMKSTVDEAIIILFFSAVLIPWATFTYLFASGVYTADIIRFMSPGTGTLTFWDRLEFSTWELKAIVWIGSSLLLIVTSLVKIGVSRRHPQTFAL